jgi:beta-galactosidase
MRTTIPLNFNWMFAVHQPSHLKSIQSSDFQSVDLPHNAVDIPYNNFDEKMTFGIFSYVKVFDADASWKNQLVRVLFEGVAHQATVYLNGEQITSHQGGYTSFEVELSKHLIYDKPNTLLVVVDTQENPGIPPFGGVVDYLGYGGIYREVSIIVTPKLFIQDVFIQTDGTQNVPITIQTSSSVGELVVTIFDYQKRIVGHKKTFIAHTETILDFLIDSPILWDLKNPHLYLVVVEYYVTQKLYDSISESFGIRKAEFKKDGFYLNGKRIKLRGLNRHQSYPYVGYAMPKQAQIDDADLLKNELFLNIVRTSHYPQSKHFLRRCDEIGLLVFEEIPGWQHIGDETWQELSCQHVKDMILRDRNHPSIILWGVRINESPDNHDFYVKTNQIARALDPTRQTGGVRNLQQSEFFEDVYTYNDFSHQGNNPGLEAKKKITKDVPYLVTEYNGHMFPTKGFDTEERRLDHTKRHLKVIDSMMKPESGISGAIGWCMSDYNTHQEFGSGDKICYHGVLDMFRIPKMASFAYRSQQDEVPVLHVSSTMNMGEHSAGSLSSVHVFTNMDYIKLYKNGEYISTFLSDQKNYPNMIHPPVIINDFIGETLKHNEQMTTKDAELTKRILMAVGVHGNHLPLKYKLQILYLLKKYKMTYDDGVKMFYKYLSGWGTKTVGYRFDGYLDNALKISVTKENNTEFHYTLTSKRDALKIEETYDVERFVLSKVNQHQELIPYAMDAFTIEVSEHLELIGPNQIALMGGAVGFWVKTKSKGRATITVKTNEGIIQKEITIS